MLPSSYQTNSSFSWGSPTINKIEILRDSIAQETLSQLIVVLVGRLYVHDFVQVNRPYTYFCLPNEHDVVTLDFMGICMI